MADSNPKNPCEEGDVDANSLFQQFESLDSTELGELTPEKFHKMFGGMKLGEAISEFQQHAREVLNEIAKHENINLDEIDDDMSDWFDDEQAEYQEEFVGDAVFARPPKPDGSCDDFPGAQQLWDAANEIDKEERLEVSVEIKSPPVTSIEKTYYHTCHYRLVFDLFDDKVTFRDVTTPRQDYLNGCGWPNMLRLPRESWPELTPIWDTVRVEQFNLREAFRSNNHKRQSREDLLPIATQVLKQALGELTSRLGPSNMAD